MTDKKDILERYLSGECSNEEKQMLEDWYASYLKNTSPQDTNWENVTKRRLSKKLTFSIKTKKNISVILTAASIAIVAAISLILFTYMQTSYRKYSIQSLSQVLPKKEIGYLELDGQRYNIDTAQREIKIDLATISLENNKGNSNTIPYTNIDIRIKSPLAQNLKIEMADGSTIVLNSGAEVIIPKEFGETTRKVRLEGEAFFNISKRTEKNASFVVEFDKHQVEVMGTSFNIDARRIQQELKVSLFTGKIKLTNGKAETFLTPGDSYQFNKVSGETQIQRQIVLDNDRAWTNDVFTFESESIQEVIKLLSQWYNIDIELAPTVDPKESFSGIISRRKNLQQVLDAINSNNQYRYQIHLKERRIIIEKS